MTSRLALNRRDFLKAAGLGAGALAANACAFLQEPAVRKPNFVIILADDLGYGDLGCYGNTTIATPQIDALASEGLRFTDFHSNGAVCSPTRASLLTGCYPQRWGIEGVLRPSVHRDKPGLPTEAVTFAEMLHDAGYATGMFGKWHLGYPEPYRPTRQGFDAFRGYLSGNVDYHSHVDNSGTEDWWKDLDRAPEEGYTTDLITRHGVDFIEAQRERPFCLYLAHEAPHSPYQGRHDKAYRVAGRADPGPDSREGKAPVYREMIEVLDEGVGTVIATLKRLGVERNTLVLFCSDNGATTPGSNAPFSGMKGGLLEGGHRVPAIAWAPGRIAPGVTGETAMTMDWLPTMAEACGAALPGAYPLDGVSLWPLLREGAQLPARTLFWRTGGAQVQKAVRQGPWKLYAKGSNSVLYNLETDPREQRDRSEEEPDRMAELTGQLAAWEEEVSQVPPHV